MENNYLKKQTEEQEMKIVKSPTIRNIEIEEHSKKLSYFEFYLPQIYDDKNIDEIENSLNVILYNSNKYLTKIRLGLFFRE